MEIVNPLFARNGTTLFPAGYEYSRYGGKAYAVLPIELNKHQRLILGEKLKLEDHGWGRLEGGYVTSV